jgi:hypothetical protein
MPFYIEDKGKFTEECIAPIVNNPKLPKEIRDSWVEYATILNIDKLHENID